MEAKKRVGIWIRVSTEDQVRGESPEHHEYRARQYAELKGWEVQVVYNLGGFSGKSIMEHPETKRMLRDIKSNTITGLIFSKLARFARNTRELLEFADYFRAESADLISLSENIDTSTPSGRFFYTNIAAMAQWEREEIADRVKASVPVRAKLGKPLGGQAPYGYRWDGKQLVIDSTEAPIRKLMYELFLELKRKQSVADELNRRGYRTRKGAKFTNTTVERLLRDPMAKGLRRSNYTHSLGQKKHWKYKPANEWVFMPCPAIVSAELWDECNFYLEQQTQKHKKPGRRSQHLLAGLIYCTCGKKMHVNQRNPVYSCPKCRTKIATQDMDDIYYEQLKSFFFVEDDPAKYRQQIDVALKEKEQLLNVVLKEAAGLRSQMEELLRMRLNKELTPERFKQYHAPLEQRLSQLEQQLPELQGTVDFLKIQQAAAEETLEEVKDLYQCWETYSFEKKRSIVEIITERIEVGKDEITVNLAYIPSRHPLPETSKQINETMSVRIL